MENMWKRGILGVVVGDALGEPVQFESREEVATHPIKGMRGYGTFNLPKGSWTDDSSLTLALLDSINKVNGIDLNDIMRNFVNWLDNGEYTPYGYAYDIGRGTITAINRYKRNHNPYSCGGTEETNNGNGSLMRIMPVCLYCIENNFKDDEALRLVELVGSLTHAHVRAIIACGLYYFMAKEVVRGKGTLKERMQTGINNGFEFYKNFDELLYYHRIRNLDMFAQMPVNQIRSSGYVVDTLEASVWSLITTKSYEKALLKAVNLGLDTDTVGAITGGLGALYYGCGGSCGIPINWIYDLQRKDWIEEMCEIADKRAEEAY